MTYFSDLSLYKYSEDHSSANTFNIGWLDGKHHFEKQEAKIEDLDLVWSHCGVLLAEYRGVHLCNLCEPNKLVNEHWKNRTQMLGSAEIRVFSNSGRIYAAPNMIFHYMKFHGYRPPDEFLRALRNCPLPSEPEYFNRLKSIGIEWDVLD